MRVLVTGANGFVGLALCAGLQAAGHAVRGTVRHRAAAQDTQGDSADAPSPMERVAVGDIGPDTDWSRALAGIDGVIHLAARVHVMREAAADSLTAFRRVNAAGTERLARMAAVAGVKRLVYVSSIKVNGEETAPPRPQGERGRFREDDAPAPQDPYAVSKWEAEQALWRIAGETGMEIVVVRPPLVYGPGVGGNFVRLLGWVGAGVPLPLAAIDNRRSLVYLGNLVDALIACVAHPGAAGRTYLVSDGEDLSTPELVRRLAWAFGRRPRLIPLHPGVLRLLGALTGKSQEVRRLIDSLEVDNSTLGRDLGWRPPFSLEQGLAQTVEWYRGGGRRKG